MLFLTKLSVRGGTRMHRVYNKVVLEKQKRDYADPPRLPASNYIRAFVMFFFFVSFTN